MAMPRYYNKKHLKEIREKYQGIAPKTDDLVIKFTQYPFLDVKAREYAHHGFARRIQTLERCISNLFKIIPPGTVKVPNRDRLHDAQIQIQSLLANTYGCVDNLAWIWVHERGLKVDKKHVALRSHNKTVRQSLSVDMQGYLTTVDKWFDYLADYRHALAHRVPPYIPPGCVHKENVDTYHNLQALIDVAALRLEVEEHSRLIDEQAELYIFQPLMTHSFNEAEGIVRFHVQSLIDFVTVEELALKMLVE
jgi:hypothetical protein